MVGQAARSKNESPVPLLRNSRKRSRVAEARPRTSTHKTHKTPNTQNHRKHPRPGHPATAPLSLREGSGKPAGLKGQPMLSLKGAEKRIRCRPQGGRGRGETPKPSTTRTKTPTTPQKPTNQHRGKEVACTGIARGGDREGESYSSLSQTCRQKHAAIRGTNYRTRAPKRRRGNVN